MVFRHDLREQSFDCHQDWMMTRDASERTGFIPERQLTFAGVESFEERRDIIRRERLAGTMPASVSRGRNGLRYAIESGAVSPPPSSLVRPQPLRPTRVRLHLPRARRRLERLAGRCSSGSP